MFNYVRNYLVSWRNPDGESVRKRERGSSSDGESVYGKRQNPRTCRKYKVDPGRETLVQWEPSVSHRTFVTPVGEHRTISCLRVKVPWGLLKEDETSSDGLVHWETFLLFSCEGRLLSPLQKETFRKKSTTGEAPGRPTLVTGFVSDRTLTDLPHDVDAESDMTLLQAPPPHSPLVKGEMFKSSRSSYVCLLFSHSDIGTKELFFHFRYTNINNNNNNNKFLSRRRDSDLTSPY